MAREEGKRKLTAPLAALAKYKYALLVAVLGALLLLVSLISSITALSPG